MAKKNSKPKIKITKDDSIHQIYDKILKNFFSIKYIMELFIKNFLKEKWTKNLDLNTLELLPNDFISKGLDNYYSDLIYKVNYKDEEIYIVILIEFQSTINKFMPLRILNYITSFYLKYLKQNDKATKLPFIFPVLFYTGNEEWKHSNEFEELIETKNKIMSKYVPKFKYFELFLNKLDRNNVVKVKNLLNQVIAMDLSNNIDETIIIYKEIVKELIDLTIEPQVKEQIKESIGLFLKYFSKNIKLNDKEINEIFSLNGGKGMLAEKMEKWIKEIKQEGKQEGIEEGIEKGIEKGAYLEKINTAKELLLVGTEIRFISKITKLSIEEIEKIKKEIES